MKKSTTNFSKFKISPMWGMKILISIILFSPSCKQYPIKKEGAKNYEAVRMEGLALNQAVNYGWHYVRKYAKKSRFINDSSEIRLYPKNDIHSCSFDANGDRECIHLLFTGDLMWVRNNWGGFVSQPIKEYMAKADLVFGNLETPIATSYPIKQFYPDYSLYNAPPDFIDSFSDSTGKPLFDGLSLANNHAMDMGIDGLEETLAYLTSKGIEPMGVATTGNLPLYHRFESKGVSIGIHNCTWGVNNPADLQNPSLQIHVTKDLAFPFNTNDGYGTILQAISQMRKDSIDIAIVFLHWGYEFEYNPDSAIRNLAKKLNAAGADLVIGSHPHVIQPVEYLSTEVNSANEEIKNTLVYYSLGNFTTTMYTTACKIGMMGQVAIVKNKQNKAQVQPLNHGYVYNNIKGFAGKKRQLLLVSADEEKRPKEISRREWKQIQMEFLKD
jgi:poly-gamma-glutamate capsule biosynthesis protein CapA/YwtB (metallophosphatase superfamily)